MSFFKVYAPMAGLESLFRRLEVYHQQWDGEDDLPAPIITCLANNEQNLYFYCKDPIKVVPVAGLEIPVPPVVVTGPKFKPVGLIFGRDLLMIKCAFTPTGTYRLLNINMQQTVNAGIDAADIWGEEINLLMNKLKETKSYDEMITLVSQFIQEKYSQACKPEEPIDGIAIKMLDPLNDHSLEEWAAMACLSLRQFERNFMLRTGISPKLFIRIARFEYAMAIKNQDDSKSWAQVALESGYTDASHLSKDFKEFAEFPPSRFYLNSTSGYSEFPTG